MKKISFVLGAAMLAGVVTQASAETMVLREVSMRTYSSTLHDDKDHPVMQIDNLNKPTSIGVGRGAGGFVFLNNKVSDWKTGKDLGMMRGMCFAVDHGDNGVFKGDFGAEHIGQGGPYQAACQMTYILGDAKNQINANGNINLTALEQDQPLTIAINGGTGKYEGIRGVVTLVQDPPGQPITYKVVIKYKK